MKNQKIQFKRTTPPISFMSSALCLGAVILICSSAAGQNLFVSSGGNIYQIDPNGVRSTFASGLGAPFALAFDPSGNLYEGDFDSGTIFRFATDGTKSTFASGLGNPFALAFDKAGNLFVANVRSSKNGLPIGAIYKFTPDGVRTTFASGLFPFALAFDSAGNLFVTTGDTDFYDRPINGSGKIYKLNPNGVRTTFASGLDFPLALAFDSAGNLFVANDNHSGSGNIYKFTPAGGRSTFAPGFGGFLALDSAGNLYTYDSDSILKFTPSGVRSTFASGLIGFLAFQPTLTPTPTLLNISTRGSVQTGENVLIAGFVVTGSDPMEVIIRGLGPTLTSFGVSDALQDPVLELHNTTSMMTSNDDWQSAANASQIPINYRPPNSHESTIMTTLQPGAYTAILSGKNSTTGAGLVEVYDLTTASSVELTSVSTRGFVGTGDNVLIGGFISSGGNGSVEVIIRALGPALAQFGVSGALADPTLSLMDSNGNVLASNDNWKATQQTVIQATGFAPSNDVESAILATLPNGNYTAIVSGKNGATGVGSVEVYKVAER